MTGDDSLWNKIKYAISTRLEMDGLRIKALRTEATARQVAATLNFPGRWLDPCGALPAAVNAQRFPS